MSETPDAFRRSTVLVEVDLPDPGEPAPLLIDLMGSLRVILLGLYRVPEQTAPEQAREQMEEKSSEALSALAEAFRNAGAEVDARVVFTPDPLATATRVAEEERCDAVVLARPLPRVRRILVPLRGAHNVRRIATFLAGLMVGSDAGVTLVHVREEDEEDEFGTWVLEEATDVLDELGVEAERVEARTLADGDPAELVIREAEDHDLLVLGESRPDAADRLFGTFSERVAGDATIPVFVIRKQH